MMSVICNWFLGNQPSEINSKIVRILWNNLLPILQNQKENYENGSKGGAPKGNKNAQKTTKTTPLVFETTPVVLKNNPNDIDIDIDIDKDIDNDNDINKDIDKDTDNRKFEFVEMNYSQDTLDRLNRLR